MQKIYGVKIAHFKAYSRRVELPLGQLTMLFGCNSVGKTSALQAILVMANAEQQGVFPEYLPLNSRWFDLGSPKHVSHDGPPELGLCFEKDEGLSHEIRYAFEDDSSDGLHRNDFNSSAILYRRYGLGALFKHDIYEESDGRETDMWELCFSVDEDEVVNSNQEQAFGLCRTALACPPHVEPRCETCDEHPICDKWRSELKVVAARWLNCDDEVLNVEWDEVYEVKCSLQLHKRETKLFTSIELSVLFLNLRGNDVGIITRIVERTEAEINRDIYSEPMLKRLIKFLGQFKGAHQKACDFLSGVSYLGPILDIPARLEPQPSALVERIGHRAEHLVAWLADHPDYLDEINVQLKIVECPYEVGINRPTLGGAGAAYLELELMDDKSEKRNLQDLGFGVSQLVPLVCELVRLKHEGGILLVEQPELHLHPKWQTDLLLKVLLPIVRSEEGKSVQVLAETHSEYLVAALQNDRIDSAMKKSRILKNENERLLKEKNELEDIMKEQKVSRKEWPNYSNENLKYSTEDTIHRFLVEFNINNKVLVVKSEEDADASKKYILIDELRWGRSGETDWPDGFIDQRRQNEKEFYLLQDEWDNEIDGAVNGN